MTSITATIQARMGSTRLPGKVLREICGKPVLKWQIDRLRRSRLIDNIIVATSTSPLDDAICHFCDQQGVLYYRGSETDVLQRVTDLLTHHNVDIHLECFGDSPLIDPQIVDEALGFYLKKRTVCDFLSSTLITTYPPGSEIVIYNASSLVHVNTLISSSEPNREHVGYNITQYPHLFRCHSFDAPSWLNYPNYYIELDTEADLDFLVKLLSHFVSQGNDHPSLLDIINFLKRNPKLVELNQSVHRRWKDLP
jgi:spore coat polysaccharide biosynthesis protein SpsF